MSEGFKIKKMLIVEKYTSFEYSEKKGKLEKLSKERLLDLKKSHDAHVKIKEFALSLLDKNKIEYVIIKDDAVNSLSYSHFDSVMSLGGDGTALHAMSQINGQFFFGVNTDTQKSLGKLTKLNRDNLENALTRFLSGKNNVELLDRLSAKVNNNLIAYLAVNEILVADPRIYKTTHLEIEVGKVVSTSISNGIIVATKQGSTAFYKSSEGIPFDTEKIGYNIIMPFSLNGELKKSKVIGINEKIIIKPKREHYKLIFDCHEKRSIDLHQGDIIEIGVDKKDELKVIT